MMMRSKSFPVRSLRKSLDPYPSLPDGVYGGDADVEMVPVTFEGHCPVTNENGSGGSLNLEACIVCDISDKWVSRCSGIDCLLSFHIECLKAELGSTEEDLAKPFYCPYCCFNTLALKSKLLEEKALGEEKAAKEMRTRDGVKESVPEDTTLAGDGNGIQGHSVDTRDVVGGDHDLQGEVDAYSSQGEPVQVDKDSDKSRGENFPSADDTDQAEDDKVIDEVEEALGSQERVSTDNFTDTDDDETAQDQTSANTCAGKENDHVRRNEKPSRRGRVVLKAIDRGFSLSESTNDQNGEDVTQPIAKVAKPKPVRDVSFFSNYNQRRRILWTYEEEEMLKVGVETYAAEANMNMPWRKILEMGKMVFHETRTSAGLKDKWRNMLIRAENKQDSAH